MKVLLLMVIVALVVFTKCYGQQKEYICTGAQLMAAIRYACKLEKRSYEAPRLPYFGGTNPMGLRGPQPANYGAIDSSSEEDYEEQDLLPIKMSFIPEHQRWGDGDDGHFMRPYFRKPPLFPFFWQTAVEPRRGKRKPPIGYMTTEQMRLRCCEVGCTKDDFRGACHFDE